MLHCIREINQQPWKRVPPWQVVVTSLAFARFFYVLGTDEDQSIFLGFVNLAFHEA